MVTYMKENTVSCYLAGVFKKKSQRVDEVWESIYEVLSQGSRTFLKKIVNVSGS